MRRLGVPTLVATLVALALLAGCEALRPATTPLPLLLDKGRPGGDRLLVLLPGRGSGADSYAQQGFVRLAREAGLTADAVTAAAHLGYYQRRVIHQRVAEDVIAPARARGVRSVWLGGISLGGLGSLITAYRYPGEVDGLLVMAPYLGPDSLIAEIEKAGGLRAWTPSADATDLATIWVWLKGYATNPAERPPLVLAYGDSDRYARGQRLLAAVLPAERVLTTPGGHDWRVWRSLWRRAVRHPLLQEALAEGVR